MLRRTPSRDRRFAAAPAGMARAFVAAMLRTAVFGCLLVLSGALSASTAAAQNSGPHSCADCHLATPTAPGWTHTLDWDRSPHGRADVRCSACHNGNPASYDAAQAHRGVLVPADPRSPVHRSNVSATCGTCHRGPYAAFQNSRHDALIRAGNENGPTCVTCHGETNGRVLSANGLATQCRACHGPGEAAPRAGRVATAREQYETLGVVREQIALARELVARVKDRRQREPLMAAHRSAEAALTDAIHAGHAFVYDEMTEHLRTAQRRATALMARLLR
jgi:hypothetical protein